MKNKRNIFLYILFFIFAISLMPKSTVNADIYKIGNHGSTKLGQAINKIVIQNTYRATGTFDKAITPQRFVEGIKLNNDGTYDYGNPQVLFSKQESCKIKMPNNLVNGDYYDHSPVLSCYDFLLGGEQGWGGVTTKADFSKNLSRNELNQVVQYFRGFGYEKTEINEDDEKCVRFEVSHHEGNGEIKYGTNSLCLSLDDEGNITNYHIEENSANENLSARFEFDDGRVYFKSTNGYVFGDIFSDYSDIWNDVKYNDFINKIADSLKRDTNQKDVPECITGKNYEYAPSTGTYEVYCLKDVSPNSEAIINEKTSFHQGTKDDIVYGVLGVKGNVNITTADVYNIYLQYLQDGEYVRWSCLDLTYGASYLTVKILKEGEIKECYVAENNNKQLYTGARAAVSQYDENNNLVTTGWYFDVPNMSLEDIIKQINSWDLESIKDQLEEIDFSQVSLAQDQEDQDPTGSQNTCMSSGASGALGWIVCPILDWMGNAAATLYNEIIRPLLEVNSSYFENQYTRDAWSVFRDAANIIFVILILVVVFSQLTGIGIDNYGIKKILPKLIVAAVLINLSYLICVICVDLSNIFGNGLQSFMDGIGQNMANQVLNAKVMEGSTVSSSTVSAAGLGSAIDTGFIAAGIITIVLSVYAIIKNPALLLTLLIVVLGVLISVLFLFILLVGREAAIVILTVISPIAFVLYMLPNTKKLFDKWLKLWEAMLFLYPICGLLIGGGNFASTLILFVGSGGSSNAFINTITALTAMVIGIIPLFFVPTLLKGAFAAMGTFGGMISGFGKRLSGGATKRMRDSGAYKNAQKMGQDRKTRFEAGYSEKRGGLTKRGRWKAKQAERFGLGKFQAAKIEAAKKNAGINEESRAILASETAAADIADSGKSPRDFFQDEINATGGNIIKLNSIISAAQKRGIKNKDIAEMIRNAANSGHLTFKDDQSRSNWMNSFVQNHNDIASTDFELQEWARNGGLDKNGNFEKIGEYGSYAGKYLTTSDVDISDLSKVSGNSMAGLIKAGLVSTSMAQQWLAANPNASSDKKIMMGAVASGSVTGGFAASAEDFKKEAEALANGKTPATSTISSGVATHRPNDNLSDLVDSWTSTAQVRAYVSQDPSTIKPGQRQRKENPVYVQGVGQSTAGQPTSGAAAENQVFNVRELADETLLDMATNPKAADNDPTRMAAELEYRRREERRQGNPQPQPQNGPQNGPQPPNGPQGSP